MVFNAKIKPIKAKWLFFSIILLFGLSACSLNNKQSGEDSNDNWENEVLLAEECGFDGLKCCDNEEEQCKFGQSCCVNPVNPEDNYCADVCEFGLENTFCRNEEPLCDSGLTCKNSRCLPCGYDGDYCCGGDACNNELICFNEYCTRCGQKDGPCCESSPLCVNEDDRGRIRTECQNGICRACGYGGTPGCENEPFCNPENLLNNDYCLQCGKQNQPCCEDKICTDTKLECRSGFCLKK
jgi:hypothetical protein